MFKAIFNFFKRPRATKTAEIKEATADHVRKFAKTTFVTPARQKGEKRVSFNATDLHKGLNLSAHYPLVCNAIDSKKFEEYARVSLVKREGVKHGASARWTFKVL